MIWACTALWLVMASGGDVGITSGLRSQLRADYGVDGILRSVRTLRLSLIEDLLHDLGLRADLPDTLGELLRGPAAAAPAPDTSVQLPIPLSPTAISLPTSVLLPTPTSSPWPSPTSPPAATHTSPPLATHTPLPPSPTAVPVQISPLLECVVNNKNGTWTAHFGYENPSASPVEIPIGPANFFSPAPDDRGQPGTFQPGRTSAYPNAAFYVTYSGSGLTWNLNGKTVSASPSSAKCVPGNEAENVDKKPPQILGAALNPAPGALETCTVAVSATGLHVFDPAYSSGISTVKLKYKVMDSSDYIHSESLVQESGGYSANGDWDGYYAGTIDLYIDSDWSSPAPDVFHIEIWAKAADQAGNTESVLLGEYTFPATCGEAQDDD